MATRTVPARWEGDLLKGACDSSAVGTLVERTTRLALSARMERTDARSAREGFTKHLRHVPALLRKTLTYDRRKEMAARERFAQRVAIQVFFADSQSPWQRGTDLSGYMQSVSWARRPSSEHAPPKVSPPRHAAGSLDTTTP